VTGISAARRQLNLPRSAKVVDAAHSALRSVWALDFPAQQPLSRPAIDPVLVVNTQVTQLPQVMLRKSRCHGLIRKDVHYWTELEFAICEICFVFTSRSAES